MNEVLDPSFSAAFADDAFVRAVARRVARSAAEADDAAQDAWLAYLERDDAAPFSPRGWFVRVVLRTARTRARREIRRERREARAARPELTEPESALLEREEIRRRLVAAVMALGKPRSTVLILRFFEDLPPRKIAERTALPVETVRTHLKRGIARLREELSAPRVDGRSWLASLPLLLPRHDLAAALAGAALVTAKTKLTVAAVVAVVAVCGVFQALQSPPAPVAPVVVGAAAHEAPPPVEHRGPDAPTSAKAIAAAPFREEDAESSPAGDARPTPGPCSLRVRVLDAAGAPVPACAIVAADAGREGRFSEERLLELLHRDQSASADVFAGEEGVHTATTDADGRAVVAGLPSTDHGFVAAFDAAHGVVGRPGAAWRIAETPEIVLQFPRAVVLRGRVTNEKGEPVARQKVDWFGERADGSRPFLLAATTDADGGYRTLPLVGRSFHGQVQRPGYVFTARSVGPLESDAREARLDFALQPAPVLHGKFVTAGGAPARLAAAIAARGLQGKDAAVQVLASARDPRTTPNFLAIGRTAGQVDLAADTWRLVATNGAPKFVAAFVGEVLVATAEPGGASEVDLVCNLDLLRDPAPRGGLRIRPVDENGAPVATASARCRRRFHQDPGARDSALAPDGAGGLVAHGLPCGKHRVVVRAEGFMPALAELEVLPAPAVAERTIVLRRAESSLEVRVRRADGSPATGARAHLLDAGALPLPGFEAEMNGEGRATISGLAAGDYTVFIDAGRASAPASARVRVAGERSVVDLEIPTAVAVRLDPEGSDGPFFLRLLDAQGTTLFDDEARDARRHFDATVLALPPTAVVLEIRCPGFEALAIPVVPKPGLVVAAPLTKLPGG